ncbi:hypothetical protein [Streptomyces sp. NPDC008265]|uniref:hypothetical protein n=1 Tax=Streptomyces sp. NPDC008265 TaxID=3364824 RepID=UPI0036F11BB3
MSAAEAHRVDEDDAHLPHDPQQLVLGDRQVGGERQAVRGEVHAGRELAEPAGGGMPQPHLFHRRGDQFVGVLAPERGCRPGFVGRVGVLEGCQHGPALVGEQRTERLKIHPPIQTGAGAAPHLPPAAAPRVRRLLRSGPCDLPEAVRQGPYRVVTDVPGSILGRAAPRPGNDLPGAPALPAPARPGRPYRKRDT